MWTELKAGFKESFAFRMMTYIYVFFVVSLITGSLVCIL